MKRKPFEDGRNKKKKNVRDAPKKRKALGTVVKACANK